jgi:hypothetical protein
MAADDGAPVRAAGRGAVERPCYGLFEKRNGRAYGDTVFDHDATIIYSRRVCPR